MSRKRVVVAGVAAVAVATMALSGCRATVPQDFGPYPVGYGVWEIEPGLWRLETAPQVPAGCTWKVLINGAVSMTGSSPTVQIPASTATKKVTFTQTGCGRMLYFHPGEWRP